MKLKPGPLFRNQFFGAPYKLGGQSKEEGFDCISFVGSYNKELGNNVPDLSDLYVMYKDKPGRALKHMWERFFKVTKEVSIGHVQSGDLVVFKHDDFGDYPGIFLGNGVVSASFADRGVTTVKYDDLIILHVRRWKD
jgi:cell wall-associated NlpC family hydrolase